jgi:hypothetical protein
MNEILVGAIGALVGAVASNTITLGTLAVRGVFSFEKRLEKRLSDLEHKIEPFTPAWHKELENRLTKLESRNFVAEIFDILRAIKLKGNPINPQRYQYLLDRMQANALTQPEAQELNDALIEIRQEAERSKNLSVLLAVGLILIVLGALLRNE